MNQTKDMTNNGYNVLPTTPVVSPKPRTMTLFFCGLQWAVISGIVLYCVRKNETMAIWALGAIFLSLALAALGLVWGVFQHVLKTIVRIVRTGS